ncbi:hypothetical protein D3C71_1661830 [compost metagenome]
MDWRRKHLLHVALDDVPQFELHGRIAEGAPTHAWPWHGGRERNGTTARCLGHSQQAGVQIGIDSNDRGLDLLRGIAAAEADGGAFDPTAGRIFGRMQGRQHVIR